jgi:hypothetical protein
MSCPSILGEGRAWWSGGCFVSSGYSWMISEILIIGLEVRRESSFYIFSYFSSLFSPVFLLLSFQGFPREPWASYIHIRHQCSIIPYMV